MPPPKVLVVLTSQAEIPKTKFPTGWYLPEFAHPYDVLKDKAEIIVVSPKGGEAPVDPHSVEAFRDETSVSFLNTKSKLWKETLTLTDIVPRAGEFDAIFYVGGHGPMFDLATNPISLALIQTFASANKPVAALCHGPAALVNATAPSGVPLLKDSTVTGFSNDEEDLGGQSDAMPFALETELNRISGGGYVKADKAWGEKVVVSKCAGTGSILITGQNPASATGLGKELAKALGL